MYEQRDTNDIEQDRVRAAAGRDYVLYSVLVLVLYFVMWLPGFIANIVFYIQASNDEKLIGRAPEGKSCLLALLIFGVIMPVLGICLALLFFGLFGVATVSA